MNEDVLAGLLKSIHALQEEMNQQIMALNQRLDNRLTYELQLAYDVDALKKRVEQLEKLLKDHPHESR